MNSLNFRKERKKKEKENGNEKHLSSNTFDSSELQTNSEILAIKNLNFRELSTIKETPNEEKDDSAEKGSHRIFSAPKKVDTDLKTKIENAKKNFMSIYKRT